MTHQLPALRYISSRFSSSQRVVFRWAIVNTRIGRPLPFFVWLCVTGTHLLTSIAFEHEAYSLFHRFFRNRILVVAETQFFLFLFFIACHHLKQTWTNLNHFHDLHLQYYMVFFLFILSSFFLNNCCIYLDHFYRFASADFAQLSACLHSAATHITWPVYVEPSRG